MEFPYTVHHVVEEEIVHCHPEKECGDEGHDLRRDALVDLQPLDVVGAEMGVDGPVHVVDDAELATTKKRTFRDG